MLLIERGRDAAIRDLDAMIARLRGLSASDWERPTPDEGWTIRHLAVHLTETIPFLTSVLGDIIAVRLGHRPTEEAGDIVTIDSSANAIAAAFTQDRNAFYHTITAMEDADLETTIPGGNGSFARSGALYLALSVIEAGVHRFDLEAALGAHEAGLDEQTIFACNAVLPAHMATFATNTGKHPDEPVSYVFQGALFDRRLTWTGSAWTQDVDPAEGTHEIRLHGDDSAIMLFLYGRIRVDGPGSDRLRFGDGSAKDKALAAQFKTYVPGP
ncbi:MAG: maleylpyruvate isomerase family mycothiol-dependent enzyme [Thermomicrobiales bacterium]